MKKHAETIRLIRECARRNQTVKTEYSVILLTYESHATIKRLIEGGGVSVNDENVLRL